MIEVECRAGADGVIRKRPYHDRTADFITVGIFADYSDERCELLPLVPNEDGHGVAAGG